MPALVSKWAALGHNISFHDPNIDADWVGDDYFTWGIHFSESGYAKIAKSHFAALKPVLDSFKSL